MEVEVPVMVVVSVEVIGARVVVFVGAVFIKITVEKIWTD